MVCRTSIYSTIDTTTLQSWLPQLIQARMDVIAGRKAQAVSYSQSDGARSVTYTPADRAAITAEIVAIQSELSARGVMQGGGRAPMRPYF